MKLRIPMIILYLVAFTIIVEYLSQIYFFHGSNAFYIIILGIIIYLSEKKGLMDKKVNFFFGMTIIIVSIGLEFFLSFL